MQNEEILKKAIAKAVKNGFDDTYVTFNPNTGHLFGIIFSHDFAKAFFKGTQIKCECHDCCISDINWQYHLQQMVISPDPLKYLEKFL